MCGGWWGSWVLGPPQLLFAFLVPLSMMSDEIDGRHSSLVRAAELQIHL
jgi:hypothetical protein